VARPQIIVDNQKYSDTDAHRTLLSVGSQWRHHMHDVKRDPFCVSSVSAELAQSLKPLVGLQDYNTSNGTFDYERGTRLEQLGELAASKIDDIDPQKPATWLDNLWPIFVIPNEPTSQKR